MILPHTSLKIETICAKKDASRAALEEPFLSYGKRAGEVYIVATDGKMLLAVPVDAESCKEDTPGFVPAWALKEARKSRTPELELNDDTVKAGSMQGPRNPNGHTPNANWLQVIPEGRKEKSIRLDVPRLLALAKAFGGRGVVEVFFEDKPDPEVSGVLRVQIPSAPDGTVALLMPVPRP